LEIFFWQWLEKSFVNHHVLKSAGFSLGRRCQRHESGIGLARFGENNFLSGMGLIDQAREVGFGLVHIDNLRHADLPF
jgi:hypothetical protein